MSLRRAFLVVLRSARLFSVIGLSLSYAFVHPVAAQSCGSQGVALQVLGSGGPELQDKRASSSYLVWENGQARALIDAGGGSALRFGESGAQMSQLDVILFTHFHVDHSADFPALIKSSWSRIASALCRSMGRRKTISCPPLRSSFPIFSRIITAHIGISANCSSQESGSYEMHPQNVVANSTPVAVFGSSDLAGSAVRVTHGAVPALAWRIEIGGKVIVFSGDTNGEGEGLVRLAKNADLLVAHNAVPEGATGIERRLHMPPSVIGQIAEDAKVKRLILSHRMLRTLGKEDRHNRRSRVYLGPIEFADDSTVFL